jgi:hypothetical protein
MRRAAASAPFWLAACAVVIAFAAGLALASHRLGEASPPPTPTPTGTATPTSSATATATPTSTPTATPLPDRASCKEMRGTAYRSGSERKWFLLHCVAPPASPARVSEVQGRRSGAPSTGPGWRELVCTYDWDCSWALAVIACESRGNPNAYNPRGPYVGLFQLLDPSRSLFDPAANIAAAYVKYQRQGPRAWGACG